MLPRHGADIWSTSPQALGVCRFPAAGVEQDDRRDGRQEHHERERNSSNWARSLRPPRARSSGPAERISAGAASAVDAAAAQRAGRNAKVDRWAGSAWPFRRLCEHYAGIGSVGGVSRISVWLVLEAVAGLDGAGGASLGLTAWELCVEEHKVAAAWERAIADGLLKPAGHDDTHDEQLWRLTAGGWAAIKDTSRDSPSTGPNGD